MGNGSSPAVSSVFGNTTQRGNRFRRMQRGKTVFRHARFIFIYLANHTHTHTHDNVSVLTALYCIRFDFHGSCRYVYHGDRCSCWPCCCYFEKTVLCTVSKSDSRDSRFDGYMGRSHQKVCELDTPHARLPRSPCTPNERLECHSPNRLRVGLLTSVLGSWVIGN